MKKGKVLIIDDDAKIRSLLELYLLNNDYEVITADRGSTGMQAIQQHHPDVVVLDIILPDLSGLELCRRIRETRDIPVIFLSGLDASETIVTGFEYGGDGYLTKPFDPNVLVANVNALLRRTKDQHRPTSHSLPLNYEALSAQELQIIKWIEKGYTNKEIAHKLSLKESTIKVYNHQIFQKLQVKNRTQAIVRAKEEGLL